MVQSLIQPEIHYPEIHDIDPEDVGHDGTLCELGFPNHEDKFMLVVFGKIKYTYHNRGILYYPVYLLTKKRNKLAIHAKIGVVEVPVKHALYILDENKDVRLDMLEDPLLFAFATEDYLERFSTDDVPTIQQQQRNPKKADQTQESEADSVVEDDDDDSSASVQQARQLLAHGVFKTNNRVVVVPAVPEETETEAKTLTETFEEKDARCWVQTFLKNARYHIHTVHGPDSDSLFACIADAFQQIGQDTTVAKLRAVVALEATLSEFKDRREVFEHLVKRGQDKEHHIKQTKLELLSKQQPGHQPMNDDKHVDALERKKLALTRELAHDDFLKKQVVGTDFAEVTSLQHFREFIMTNRFYPDDWAINVLEHKLDMKLVLLSESEFEDGDVHHVLHCPTSSGTRKTPKFYIVAAVNKKHHYSLVTYKNKADQDVGKRIFAFAELPWGLKQHIAQRCAERSGHGFHGIAEFDDLASQRGYQDENESGGVPPTTGEVAAFQFHRLASLRAAPGKGPNEHLVVKADALQFHSLGQIRAWRRKLDDTWAQSKFTVDGKTWASVVHYMQSRKFRKKHPEYADTFSLDSRTALSKNVDLALAATTKDSKTTKTKVRPSVIDMDPDQTPEEIERDRVTALHAKFSQNADVGQVLAATHPATLLHYAPRHVAKPDAALMALRERMAATTTNV